MAEYTETTQRLFEQTDRFIYSVEMAENGIGDKQLPESINQLTIIYSVYFEGFFAKLGHEDSPPQYPFDYSDFEKRMKDDCRIKLAEPFERQCENLGAALTCTNQSVSEHLFMLARCFEAQESERIPGIWRAVHAGLQCSLAKLALAREDRWEPSKSNEGKKSPPPLSELASQILEIIREHGPITEKDILKKLPATGVGTVRTIAGGVLTEHYGVKNDQNGKGYYIAADV